MRLRLGTVLIIIFHGMKIMSLISRRYIPIPPYIVNTIFTYEEILYCYFFWWCNVLSIRCLYGEDFAFWKKMKFLEQLTLNFHIFSCSRRILIINTSLEYWRNEDFLHTKIVCTSKVPDFGIKILTCTLRRR